MKAKILTLAILIFVSCSLFSQVKLESISLASEFLYGVKGINYVEKVSGIGFSGDLKFGLGKSGWKLKIFSGYSDSKLFPSDSMTIERWNWDYWKIWYRSHVRSLIVDSNYAVNLNPEQRLYLLPVKFYLGRDFESGKLKIFAGAGFGLTVYERAFWLNETWWKRFQNLPDSGEVYIFQYSFKNNAPSKKGTVLSFGLYIGGTYALTKIASLKFGLEFEHYPSLNGIEKVEFGKIIFKGVREADKNFVLRDVLKLTFGFSFNY
jgi:hypothetical protein